MTFCLRLIILVFLSALFEGCYVEVKNTGPEPIAEGLTKFHLKTLPVPAIISEIKDREAARIEPLRALLTRELHSMEIFSYVGSLPAKGPVTQIYLDFRRQDRSDEDRLNIFKVALSAISLFLLNPLLPIEHHLSADANLRVVWPDQKESAFKQSCQSESLATLDKERGTLEQAEDLLESACIKPLMAPLVKESQRHIIEEVISTAPDAGEFQLPQRRFSENLSAEQRKNAIADICKTLGFTPGHGDFEACLRQVKDVDTQDSKHPSP